MRQAIFIIGCCFFVFAAQGQNDPLSIQKDSLSLLLEEASEDSVKARLYTTLHELYLHHEPYQAMEYARLSLYHSERIPDSVQMGKSYGDIMNAHYIAGSHADSLLKYLLFMETAFEADRDSTLLMETYWGYATYYGNVGMSDKQMEYYLKALSLIRQLNANAELEAMLLNNIGSTLYSQGKVKEAISYFEESLAIVEDDVNRANLLQNCATLYEELGRSPDTIEQYYDMALSLYRQVHDNGGIALVLLKKGRLLDARGQHEAAIALYKEAQQLIETFEIGHMWYKMYRTLARHHEMIGDYRGVIHYATAAINVIEAQQNYFNTAAVYKMLHQAYAKLGEHESAYRSLNNWMMQKDSMQSQLVQERTEELKARYKTEQKEIENQLLMAQQANAQKSIRNRNLIIAVGLLVLLLTSGWLTAVLIAVRKKREHEAQLEATVKTRTGELMHANQELEQANYELRSFSYIASHDIKEPIRNIGNYAGLINRRLPKQQQEAFQEYFGIIEGSVLQLYTLAEDLSAYINLSKESALAREEVDLNALIGRVKAIVQPLLDEKKGELLVDDLPGLYANTSLLFVALKNLVENGLKYNQSEVPQVQLSYQQVEGFHVLSVADNGIGIEPAYQEQIFEMFKRLHSREAYHGSGIGLALVKLAAKKLNGRVELESALGEGSKFQLYLPV